MEHLIKAGAEVGVAERVEDRVQFRVDVAEPRDAVMTSSPTHEGNRRSRA
mgnify:CR=1 FL=1